MKFKDISIRKDVYSGLNPFKKDKRKEINEDSQRDYFLFKGTKYI